MHRALFLFIIFDFLLFITLIIGKVQCRHLVPVLIMGRTGKIHPIATKFPRHGCTDDHTTERSFDSQATWVINVLGFILDILLVGV